MHLTLQEYFEWEAQQTLRYKYFDGEAFAMAGGSIPHAEIALNFASFLRDRLRSRCKVRNSDAKVGITEEGPFTYPDLSVTCDERDRTAQQFSRYPCLIVEVVSPSTETYDRVGRVLVVVCTMRNEEIRIISARKATRRERQQYGER